MLYATQIATLSFILTIKPWCIKEVFGHFYFTVLLIIIRIILIETRYQRIAIFNFRLHSMSKPSKKLGGFIFKIITRRCWVAIFSGNILMVIPIRIDQTFLWKSVIRQQETILQNICLLTFGWMDSFVQCEVSRYKFDTISDIQDIWLHNNQLKNMIQ